MEIHERLANIASLIEQGVLETNATLSKTASTGGNSSDLLNTLHMGIVMQAKKASYLNMFQDLSNKGVLK